MNNGRAFGNNGREGFGIGSGKVQSFSAGGVSKMYGGGAFGQKFGGAAVGSRLQAIDWARVNVPKVVKELYSEHPDVTNRPVEEGTKWIKDNEVTLDGQNIPRPIFEFKECTFPSGIVKMLYANYTRPTVIQSISWPVALCGRDIISIARTGSGKTLGFILPAIVHISKQTPRAPRDGPIVLVLLPTRELAQQVEEVARDYCKAMNLGITCLFGGASKRPQANDLQRGVDICIATPGRLLDFLEMGTTNLLRCSYLVLDEADRMLDMGFEPQIRKIVAQIRPDRQTMMFSATWPKEVRILARDFQTSPVFMNVGSMELSANHNIEQVVEVVEEFNKPKRLSEILRHIMDQKESKTMIFVETKRKADEITKQMRKDGWPALSIHGDKSQAERDWVMREFREGRIPILLATDVASRGLDVSDVKFVINYDYPKNSEDYVHRIGRTGRRDKKGTSYTFFSSKDSPKAAGLLKVLREAKQHIPEALAGFSKFSSRINKGSVRGSGINKSFRGIKRW